MNAPSPTFRRHGPPSVAWLALLLAVSPAEASWPPLGGAGLTVCDAPGSPNLLASAPDGLGGVFVAWIDGRAGFPESRLFAQHVDAAGTPLWTEDGELFNSSRIQEAPRLVPDGANGVILVWRDFRADTAGNVYAQRLDGAGTRLWSPGDVVVAAGPLHETMLAAAPDGAGGALVSWSDDRTGTSDVRAQRLTADGLLDWGPDGVAMSTTWMNNISIPSHVCSDAAGGALVGFLGFVSGNFNTFIQRLSPTGELLWTAGGVRASSSSLGVFCTGLAADGTGGALVSLGDYRSQNTWVQAFAQRIAADGSVAWPADGVALSGGVHPVEEQAVIADDAGGGFFEWRIYLNDGSGVSHLCVQRLSATGAPEWNPATLVVAAPTEGNGFLRSRMVPDGAGGLVLGWNAEGTSGGFDVSAQRIAGDGTPLWSPGPRVLASLPHTVWQLGLVPDGTGGVLASWMDSEGFTGSYTVAVERLMGTGTLDVPYAGVALRGVQCTPSPARAGAPITLRFALARPGPASVRVVDVTGRLVRSLRAPSAAAGVQVVPWDGRDEQGRGAPPGLYLLRVDAAGTGASGRVVLLGE